MKISTKIINVPLPKIKEDPNQPRQHFTKTMIEEMATSIKNEGIINPIEIDKNSIIITGAIRFKATKVAGLKVIPCKLILEIDNSERFIRQMQENLHHNTMSAWDTAKGLEKTIEIICSPSEQTTKSSVGRPAQVHIRKLTKLYGKSMGWIVEHLKLLQQSKDIQEALMEEKISYTQVREASKAPEQYQENLKKKVIKQNYIPAIGVSAISSALNRSEVMNNPKAAKKLLEADYKDKEGRPMTHREIVLEVNKIIPDTQTILAKDIDRVKAITGKASELEDLLKENSLASIKEPLSKMSLIFQLKVLILILNKYLTDQMFASQLKEAKKDKIKLLKKGE